MEEVEDSISSSSTHLQLQALAEAHASAGFFFGGLVAGEGSFIVTQKRPTFANGDPRLRFVFALTMAVRDEALVRGLQTFLGAGSTFVARPQRSHWQPTITLTVNSIAGHRRATIPFAEAFLLPSQKRHQFESWRERLEAFDAAHPNRYGKGPALCSVDDCDNPVRGRGLCRKHYYVETGY